MVKEYLKNAEWVMRNDKNEYKGTLDENGQTDLKNIKQGEYEFTLSKKGYQTKTIDVIVDDNPISIDIDLEKEPKKSAKKTTAKKSAKKSEPEVKEQEKPKKSSKKSTKKSSKKDDTKKDDDKK